MCVLDSCRRPTRLVTCARWRQYPVAGWLLRLRWKHRPCLSPLALSLSRSLADIQSFCAWPVLPCIHSIYVVSAAAHVPHLRSRLFFTRRITAPSNPFACNALVLLLLASFGLIAPMPPPYAWVLSLRPSIPIPLSRPLSFLFISLSSSLALVNSTRSFPLRTSSRSSQGKPVTMSRR